MSFFDHLYNQSLCLQTGHTVQWQPISQVIDQLYENQCLKNPDFKKKFQKKVFRVKTIHSHLPSSQ